MISKRIINPYFSEMLKNLYFAAGGKNAKKIFEPSSGGTGIKLKIAKLTFIRTTNAKIFNNPAIATEETRPK